MGGARPAAARPEQRMTRTALLASAKLVTMQKTTIAGATLRLASARALNPDCSPIDGLVVKVTAPPDHGTVRVEQAMDFSDYKPGDPPFMCNAQKTPSTLVTYRANAGYVGEDVAVVQVFFPDGRAPVVRYDITVR